MKWNYDLKLRDLLSDSDDHDNARTVAKVAVERIVVFIEEINDTNLKENLLEIKDLFEFASEDEDDPIAAFNYALDNLYDIGDYHRIWIS